MEEQLIDNFHQEHKVLVEFRDNFITPLKKRLDAADNILKDKDYKWKVGEKENANSKYQDLKERYDIYKNLYDSMLLLLRKFARFGGRMADIYRLWYNKVSYKGKQQTEMMQSQADILQEIFTQIFEIIEPIKAENLKAPNNEK